ncbi:MAG: alanine and proline-rich secreted protein Apa [Gammaproteobacteria bacterium]|nr:alanine and proline-rich secreted protein Apa [Gammaproteobacteria bacterium]MDH5302884.1 alanine and proline-rich secreted protein Apa [Gammaproteobacteria bacterium]MDH5320989.1 alanine and proline-rich secreted protein Apa [Gammaproteobacteria bacterium]
MNLKSVGKAFVLITVVAIAAWAQSDRTPAPLSPPPVLATDKDAQGRPIPFGPSANHSPGTPLGSGPYPAVMATDPGLPEHVFYHPVDLDAAGELGIVVWGNGGCLHAGNRFRIFLSELASHGFLVISAGPIGHIALEVGPQENPFVALPGAAPPPPPPAPIENDPTAPWRSMRSTADHMREAIDWAIAQNTDAHSAFYGRLDTEAVGAGGQSCGGGLTTSLAGDARLRAIGIFNSGTRLQSTFGREVTAEQAAEGRRRLDAVHTPTLILTGDQQLDIAYSGGHDTFDYLSSVPVFHAWQEGLTHIGTYGAPNGGSLGRIASDWYKWQLQGDQQAASMFAGTDCLLCQDKSWHVQKKNMD